MKFKKDDYVIFTKNKGYNFYISIGKLYRVTGIYDNRITVLNDKGGYSNWIIDKNVHYKLAPISKTKVWRALHEV